MFEKRAYFKLIEIEALNKPVLSSILQDQQLLLRDGVFKETIEAIKTAAHKASKEVQGIPSQKSGFDLEAEIRDHPDSLFVKCFAIKADEMNDNGDWFSREELIKATATFVGVPVFTNHQNSDINQARGKVVHSWWDDPRNGIMIIARVDAAAYPQLARGIKEDYVAGTSMGCSVQYSLCSICHNFATNPADYCAHIKERKTRKFSGKAKCIYKKNGPKDQECPICASVKDINKDASLVYSDQSIFEHNYGIKFIENSFVVNPACHSCGVTEVIDPSQFLAKVANLTEQLPILIKAAQNVPIICDENKCVHLFNESQTQSIVNALSYLQKGSDYVKQLCLTQFEKFAGQEQINQLNQALDLMTSVSQDMLMQKQQIDLEFLSDLVKVLADLQKVTDELTEQGYGRLPSPTKDQETTPGAALATQPPAQTPQQPAPATATTGRVQTGTAGAAGTVTAPTAKKKLDLQKTSLKLAQKNRNVTPPSQFPKKIDFKLQLNKKNDFDTEN